MNLVLFKFAPCFVWERKLECFSRIEQALLTCPQVLNVPVTQVFRKIIDTWTNMQVWCKFDTLQVCAHLVMRNKSRVFLRNKVSIANYWGSFECASYASTVKVA
jgi:hypothetical protein